jgi:hypothetical protein
VFRSTIPLGECSCGTIHHSARIVDHVPNVDRGRFLAARAHLRGDSSSARRVLSILTSIGQPGASEQLATTPTPNLDETARSVREAKR